MTQPEPGGVLDVVYEIPVRTDDRLFQGDILSKFPFPWLDQGPIYEYRLAEDRVVRRNVEDLTENDRLLIATNCVVARVIVLSQSCDIDDPRKPTILFSPVLTIPQLELPQEKLDQLRSNPQRPPYHICYLPACGDVGMEESYVDFGRICSIQKTNGKPLTTFAPATVMLRMLPPYREMLAQRLGFFISRVAVLDLPSVGSIR
jgi:hypothetical protein